MSTRLLLTSAHMQGMASSSQSIGLPHHSRFGQTSFTTPPQLNKTLIRMFCRTAAPDTVWSDEGLLPFPPKREIIFTAIIGFAIGWVPRIITVLPCKIRYVYEQFCSTQMHYPLTYGEFEIHVNFCYLFHCDRSSGIVHSLCQTQWIIHRVNWQGKQIVFISFFFHVL